MRSARVFSPCRQYLAKHPHLTPIKTRTLSLNSVASIAGIPTKAHRARCARRVQSASINVCSERVESTSRPRSAPDVWMWIRTSLERRGDTIITCANVLQLSGFACSDALHLQSIMIFGNGGMALFFITRMPSMGIPFVWAFLKVCINVFMVFKLTSERQPIRLTDEEFDVYEEHFMPFGVTAREFKRFWDLGANLDVAANTNIIREGDHCESVAFVLSGHVFRTHRGKHIQGLDSHPGRQHNPEGDAGAWISEINALQMIDTVAAPESVSRDLCRRSVQRTLHELSSTEDGLEGDTDEPALEALRKFKDGFALKAEHKEHVRVRWTVTTGEFTKIRTWKLKPLMEQCKSDTTLSSVVRKVFSQSAIKKILSMDAAAVSLTTEGWKDDL